jgi:hypothetical protein
MKINLHIERMVLDGLPVSQRDGVAMEHALRQELVQVLGTASFSQGQTMATLRGIDMTVAKSDAKTIGAQIARSIHGGLTK